MYDICIIGGGASGLTAAISAMDSKPGSKVIILEKKDQPGKKILATGNGKCNLSNEKCQGYRDVLSFFQNIGVITRMDDAGRFYPYTEDARDVANGLIQRAKSLGVHINCESRVDHISKDADGFHVEYTMKEHKESLECDRLLIACGGKAGPGFGTVGDGYRLAKELGHSVTRLAPALTAVELYEDMSTLAGIRAKAKASLTYKGEEVFEETGEVQFTKYGISGICVFDLSRFLVLPEGAKLKGGFDDYTLFVNFFPKGGNIEEYLDQRSKALGITDCQVMRSMVRQPIAERIYEMSGGDLAEMAQLLQAFPLHPKGLKGWDFAQVTKGGVPESEIHMDSMESRLVKELFFSGEILDYEGPCGGFNLQYAWETGIRAGKGMSR